MQSEIEKRRKINQNSCSDWQHARVFSVKVSRTALILFLLSSPSLIHHLPPRPSWCCRLLLNVSPNSPSSPLLFIPLSLLFLILSPSRSRLRGRLFGARWRLRNNAPLIFLFCNLQRRRTSCFTCVIFNSCPSLSFAPHYSATEAVFHYLFSLCPQIRYMTGWTQAQKRQLPGAEVIQWGWGCRIRRKSPHPKAARHKNSSTPNSDIDKGVSCFFWYFFAHLFS